METVHKNGKPNGVIQLKDLLDNANFIGTPKDIKVIGDREYCLRLHTTARTFYFQFEAEVEKEDFIKLLAQKKS